MELPAQELSWVQLASKGETHIAIFQSDGGHCCEGTVTSAQVQVGTGS